ncbi:MAG: hypothetical protein Q4F00_00035 [bacterium]|nr:hypothetical protein [bacterium]
MRQWLGYLAFSLAALFLFSASGQALEQGDRAPKLTLATADGKVLNLPDKQLPSPTLVWFPLAWRTPAHLCDKLISVAKDSQATLVIIPIYDYAGLQRLAHPLSSESDSVSADGEPAKKSESDSHTADLPGHETVPSVLPSQGLPKPEEQPTGNLPPAGAAEPAASGQETVLPSSASSASSPDNLPASGSPTENNDVPAVPEKFSALQAQQLFRERVETLAQRYPEAIFICDADNQALLAYTDSFITNILPNPDLFIIDAQGFISWRAFYPGLTVGTLTRAIITARPKQSSF